MPTGWGQQAGNEIRKGVPCMVCEEVCQKFLFFKTGLRWPWFTPRGSSGRPNSKSCTCRSLLYILKMFIFWGLDCSAFFCVNYHRLVCHYCQVEILCLTVLLLSVWWWLRQWVIQNSSLGAGDLVHISVTLELCGGICFSDPILLLWSYLDPCSVLYHPFDCSITAGRF